jgi:hypothetical protein
MHIGEQEDSMRQRVLVAGLGTLVALSSAAMIKLIVPATSLAAPSRTVPISADELQSQMDVRPLPLLRIEDLFEAVDRR